MNSMVLGGNDEQCSSFRFEYEFRINKLKLDFIHLQQAGADSDTLGERYRSELRNIRQFVRVRFDYMDAHACSSLHCVPTKPLDASERVVHRIWMGGALPVLAWDAIAQWGLALEEVERVNGVDYLSILWVWDELQLANDPLFKPTGGPGKYCVGQYQSGGQTLHINSLRALAWDLAPDTYAAIDRLHAQRYFATLSDYFRFLILIEFGGVYMDVDTIPYRPATIFLSKPEVPDFDHVRAGKDGGGRQTWRASWMNLFLDETGMIIARKRNAALGDILAYLNGLYATLPRQIPEQCPQLASALFDAFYGEWEKHLGTTSISQDALYREHCVMYCEDREDVTGGIRGMRLLADIITNTTIPLSAAEQRSYEDCVAALERIHWTLDRPLDLPSLVDVFTIAESPRMAYAAQLRADIEHFHYYSVLSEDARLDRVNALFCRYLIAANGAKIAGGQFWHPVCGQHAGTWIPQPAVRGIQIPRPAGQAVPAHNAALLSNDPLGIIPGRMLGEDEKTRIAKLLFATSYLEYCSAGNKLNLEFVELQKRQNIEPYLDYVHGLHDREGEFVGFFTAATLDDFNSCLAVSYYRDEMKPLDSAYDAFVEDHACDGDYFVSSLALEDGQRGKGLFSQMFREIEQAAQRRGCGRITLTVWGKSEAFPIYLKKGFRVAGRFDYAFNIFYDTLYFLQYDLNAAGPAARAQAARPTMLSPLA